jgi:hypothetical protein
VVRDCATGAVGSLTLPLAPVSSGP